MLALPIGFEPTTCRLGGDRSILLSYGSIEYDSIVSKILDDVNRNQPVGAKIKFLRAQIPVKFFLGGAYSTFSGFLGGERMGARSGTYADIDDMIFAEEVSLPSDR